MMTADRGGRNAGLERLEHAAPHGPVAVQDLRAADLDAQRLGCQTGYRRATNVRAARFWSARPPGAVNAWPDQASQQGISRAARRRADLRGRRGRMLADG